MDGATQPRALRHCWPYSPAKGGRHSWGGWLVALRGGQPIASGRSRRARSSPTVEGPPKHHDSMPAMRGAE